MVKKVHYLYLYTQNDLEGCVYRVTVYSMDIQIWHHHVIVKHDISKSWAVCCWNTLTCSGGPFKRFQNILAEIFSHWNTRALVRLHSDNGQQRVWTHLSNEVHPSIFVTFWNRHSDNHTSCSDCQVCTGAKVWSNQGRTVLKSTVTPICMKQCISCVSLMSVYIKLSGFYYEAVIVNAIYWSSRLALTVINHAECTS